MEVAKWEDLKVGDEISFTKGPIEREGIQAYGKASGDRNPIHMSEKAAIRAGLDDVIAHGLYNMAHVNQMLADWAGPKGMVKKIDVQFRGMVRVGDMAISKGKITKKYEEEGKKCIDLDIWQEAKMLVSRSTVTLSDGNIEKAETELTDGVFRGFLKRGERDIVTEVGEKYEKEGKTCIDINTYRIQRSIIGTAKTIHP
jgi:acyl dehydratase